jgi:hypothetical protein
MAKVDLGIWTLEFLWRLEFWVLGFATVGSLTLAVTKASAVAKAMADKMADKMTLRLTVSGHRRSRYLSPDT